MRTGWRQHIIGAMVVVLVLAACSATESDPDEAPVMVAKDVESETLVVNVTMTDEGFEPSRIVLPAGNHVRLVLRNRGSREHHFRVAGLLASDLLWYLAPDISEDELEAMTPEELEELGIGEDEDLEHVSHHLAPTFVPFKEASIAGIKPIGNEVHGYAQWGQIDVLTFYPLSVGTFVAEDVLNPDITGEVVVIAPEG